MPVPVPGTWLLVRYDPDVPFPSPLTPNVSTAFQQIQFPLVTNHQILENLIHTGTQPLNQDAINGPDKHT